VTPACFQQRTHHAAQQSLLPNTPFARQHTLKHTSPLKPRSVQGCSHSPNTSLPASASTNRPLLLCKHSPHILPNKVISSNQHTINCTCGQHSSHQPSNTLPDRMITQALSIGNKTPQTRRLLPTSPHSRLQIPAHSHTDSLAVSHAE
jgi:hypothetical protein